MPTFSLLPSKLPLRESQRAGARSNPVVPASAQDERLDCMESVLDAVQDAIARLASGGSHSLVAAPEAAPILQTKSQALGSGMHLSPSLAQQVFSSAAVRYEPGAVGSSSELGWSLSSVNKHSVGK